LEVNEIDVGPPWFPGAVSGEVPHLATLETGPPWHITRAPSPLSIKAFGPSWFIQGSDPSLKPSPSVGSGPIDVHGDQCVIHILGGSGGVPWLLSLASALSIVVALIPPVEWLFPVVVWAEQG
jgi:hypothetical protein